MTTVGSVVVATAALDAVAVVVAEDPVVVEFGVVDVVEFVVGVVEAAVVEPPGAVAAEVVGDPSAVELAASAEPVGEPDCVAGRTAASVEQAVNVDPTIAMPTSVRTTIVRYRRDVPPAARIAPHPRMSTWRLALTRTAQWA